MTDTAWDSYIENTRIDQAALLDEVRGLVRPRITRKALARLSGLNLRTLDSFMNGEHTLRPDHFDRLQAAVEALEGGD